MAGTFDYFKAIIIIQLFFGFAVTLVAYTMPTEAQDYVTIIQPGRPIDLGSVSKDIQESAERQMQIPLLDLGALVFYSGNIVIDLILNSIFAIPEMITIIANIFFSFFPIDAYIANYLKLFIMAVISAVYILGILAFMMNIRSTGNIA
jgi:hypothetical protein